MLWTYAEPRNGVLTRVGGGTYDAATDTYGQGAFNADDVARAAVVYIRHWVATGSPSSRDSGVPDAARPDLPPDGERRRTPATSCSGCSPTARSTPARTRSSCPTRPTATRRYWVARTIWALGEGYAAFAATGDPADEAFAGFLRDRLELSIDAVDRQVLDTYGQLVSVDGRPTPRG